MRFRRRLPLPLAFLAASWGASHAFGQLAAFPGAQGFGGNATGGRGGSVYVVTNLNASGAGSFADAVSQSNRIVVFAVGGYIDLTSPVTISSNVTILGQTAPGQGIGIMGSEVSASEKSNIIIQYMRFREGSLGTQTNDSLNIGDATNVMIDHTSIEFGEYNNLDATGNNGIGNVTVQNSIFADPTKGQQFNAHIQGNTGSYPNSISLLNNVFTNAHNRNPMIKANDQFVNNVVYNFQGGYTVANTGGNFSQDIVNNYFITGPSTTNSGDAFYQMDSNISAYVHGNMEDSNDDGGLNGSALTSGSVTNLSSPWNATTALLPTLSAAAAYTFDMAHAGDSLNRDAVDAQVISQVQSLGTQGQLFNSQTDDGLSNTGYSTLTGGAAPKSTANDGIPDTWALAHGLSITDTAGATKLNPLGYDMIEQYAEQIGDEYSSQIWTAAFGEWQSNSGNWSSALPGDFDHAVVHGNGTANGIVNITKAGAVAFDLRIGGNGPAAGEQVIVAGGTLTIFDTIYVGDQNNATFQLNSGTVTADNVQLGDTVWNASGTASMTYTGSLQLNGGTLATNQVVLGGGTPGNWTTGGSILWNGGAIQAAAPLLISVPATLAAGGAVVNTNGFGATVSGILSGSGSFTKTGAGILRFTASNIYTGPTIITGGTITLATLPNGGVAGPIGASSNAATNLVLNGGTLQYTGSGVSTDRLFTLTAGGGTLDGSGSGGLAFINTGSVAVTGTGSRTLTLTGSSNNNDLQVALGDPTAGATSLVVNGSGRWLITAGANLTYSGDTSITAGTLMTYNLSNALPFGTGKGNVNISAGATLEMNGNTLNINGLNGAGNLNDRSTARTLTIGNGNATGTFSGTITGAINLAKTGIGTQILTGANTFTGNTAISGGTLIANGNAALPTGVGVVDNAGLVVNGTQTISGISGTGSLVIGSTGFLQITETQSTSTIGQLTINPGGNLDITNNALLINYTAAGQTSPNAAIRAALASGAGTGGTAYNGIGIMSSTAARLNAAIVANGGTPKYGVGYADGSDPYLNSEGPAAGTEEVKFTLLGDLNLDGVVNSADFILLADSFGQSGASAANWDHGDLNYDGSVNSADFILFADNFGQSLGAVSSADGGLTLSQGGLDAAEVSQFNSIGSDLGISTSELVTLDEKVAAVPEPASVGMIFVGAIGLLTRRRRRCI
jgi:autotransporter-associated beta strand protein